MEDRSFLRFGGGAAMLAAVLGLVFNLLHPRTSDYGSVQAELELAADSGIWLFDHYMLAWSLAFLFIGLVAIGRTLTIGTDPSWGRLAIASAIGSVAIALVTVAVDGMAFKEVADAGQGPEATAVAHVSGALFTATIGSLFGVTPVLYGLAYRNSDWYAGWLAPASIVAGLGGLLTASIQFFGGVSALTTWLFVIVSVVVAAILFVAGWTLWQRTATTTAAAATPTA